MRLIDADALIKRLEKSHEYHAKTSREEVLLFRDIRIINEQPTAYDPDKVVEQLKDRSTLSRPVGWTKPYEIVTLSDAIEIAKGGGTDG